MIEFLSLEAATRELRPDLDRAIGRVLDRGWFIGGPECETFEADFATYCESDHAIGVGNGLDALILALRALGIDVVHDSPDVGRNLQDHLDVILQWQCTQPITLNGNAAFHRKIGALFAWLFTLLALVLFALGVRKAK